MFVNLFGTTRSFGGASAKERSESPQMRPCTVKRHCNYNQSVSSKSPVSKYSLKTPNFKYDDKFWRFDRFLSLCLKTELNSVFRGGVKIPQSPRWISFLFFRSSGLLPDLRRKNCQDLLSGGPELRKKSQAREFSLR